MEDSIKIKGGSFKTMNLNGQLFRNIPFENPTPIQRKIIPLILQKQSIMGIGRTGSGKSYCYMIPAIQKAIEGKKTLVLLPTKELLYQTRRIYKYLTRDIENIDGKIEIATLGRYTDLDVSFLVVDEIDRVLEEPDLRKEFDYINEKLNCQKAFFSATKPDTPLDIKVIEIENKINQDITHVFFYIPSISKESALLHVLDRTKKTIIFVSTKYAVEYLLEVLEYYKITARGIYSSMDTDGRKLNFKDFCKGIYNTLVVTDVAARGLDIPLLDVAVSYDLCDERTFLHRVGRIRGLGTQYTFVTYNDIFHFFNIQQTYLPNAEIGKIPQEILDRYDLSQFASSKVKLERGYEKCLRFRRKVSVPEEYKEKIDKIIEHSIFKQKETLSNKLQEFYNSKKPHIKEKPLVLSNKFKDQTFIPYTRKDSRIHSSAFAVYKDDYIRERREKYQFKMQRMKRKGRK